MLTTTITPQTFSGKTSPHATVMSFFPIWNYPTSSYCLSINKREKEFQTATTKAQEGNLQNHRKNRIKIDDTEERKTKYRSSNEKRKRIA